MNKVYQRIWSKVKERWIVGALTMAAFLALSGPVYALDPGTLPTGGKITAGSQMTVVSQPIQYKAGIIVVAIPDNLAQPGSSFLFKLPEQLADSATGISIETASLPAWLYYNSTYKVFIASNVPDGFLPVTVPFTVGGQSWSVQITKQQIL